MNYKKYPSKRLENIARLLECTAEFFESVQPGTNPSTKFTPSNRYLDQKRKAKKRGIVWNFNFKDWWDIWNDSGKWNVRGRGKGYCMARFGDVGAYEKNNVHIITIGDNFSESFVKNPQNLRRKKAFKNGNLGLEKKEFCKRGHKLSKTRVISKNGSSDCSECKKIRQAKYIAKRNLVWSPPAADPSPR
jgi:hypothetical protein